MKEAFEDLKKNPITLPVFAFPDFDSPFVFERGASSVALGVIPVQKKEDGKVQPIRFASRAMIEQERQYSTSERKALWVMLLLKKFWVYVVSEKHFAIYTDHQALQYAFKKKSIHGRLAPCLDLMAEHNFKVMYHSESSNVAADYPYRLPIVKGGKEENEILTVFFCHRSMSRPLGIRFGAKMSVPGKVLGAEAGSGDWSEEESRYKSRCK